MACMASTARFSIRSITQGEHLVHLLEKLAYLVPSGISLMTVGCILIPAAAAAAGIARSSQLSSTCPGRLYGPAGQTGRKNDSYKSHLLGPQSTELTRGPPELVQHFRL